jgi:hypothetical protein
MPKTTPSPLDALSVTVMRAQGNREALEADLERIPSWRFRRRRRTARAAEMEREREARLREVLQGSAELTDADVPAR